MLNRSRRKTISKIIEDNLDYLVRFAYFRLSDRTEAEDLVYEAILRFLEKDDSAIKPESVRLYLFRMVYNLCLDRARRRCKESIPIESIEIEDNDGESVLDIEEAARINTCLASLPQREADIIRMNVVDGLSFVDISSILSIPQSTAKSRYKSGMDKLRKLFTKNKSS